MLSSSRVWWIAAALLAGCGNNNNNNDGGTSDDSSSKKDAKEHVDAKKADAPNQEQLGSAFDLQSVQGIAYLASITIGDGQTFALDVDTGSTTLGVAGATCTSCNVSPEWTPDSTAVAQHQNTEAEYGDQSTWSGPTFSDAVQIQGDTDVTLVFGEITAQTGFLIGGADQGIIGFLGPGAAFANTGSYMSARADAGLPTEFSFQFCPDVGHLWFGGFEPSSVVSTPQFTPLAAINDQQPFFALDVTSTTINGSSIGLSGAVIADTGTSLMVVPTAAENALISKVQASSGYQSIFSGQTLSEDNCLDPGSSSRADIDAALPPMVFTLPKVGGGSFTLTAGAAESYLFFEDGSGYCLGLEADSQVSETILGVAFLRQFVSVFDGPDGKIGFANEAGCNLPAVVTPTRPLSHKPPHWYRHGHPKK